MSAAFLVVDRKALRALGRIGACQKSPVLLFPAPFLANARTVEIAYIIVIAVPAYRIASLSASCAIPASTPRHIS